MTRTESTGAEGSLWRLMDEVARAGSLGEICEYALDCLCDSLGVERSSVLLFDESGTMRFVAWRGLSETYRAAADGHSPWSPDEEDARPLLVPDASRDESLASFRPVLDAEGIGALAFIPLRFGDKLLGKFMLYYAVPHEFSEAEVSLARTIAGYVAFAVEQRRRLRAEQDARRDAEIEVTRRQRLERQKDMLVRAGHALSRSLEQEGLLEALSGVVVPEFADWYAVFLSDDSGEISPVHISHGDPEKVRMAWELSRRWPVEPGSPTGVAAAIERGRSVLAPRIEPEVLAGRARSADQLEMLQALGLHSVIILPLALPDRNIGAMLLVTAESQRSFDEDDVPIAQALASRAALALEQARLYEQVRTSRDAARDAARRLDMLSNVSEIIARSLDPDAALKSLAEFIASTLADYCVAYRLGPDGTIVRAALAHGDPDRQELVEKLVRAGPPELDDAYGAGSVLRTGEPILASDIPPSLLEQTVQNATHLEILRELGPRSSLIVPLKARGHALGALALATTDRSGRRYTHSDLKLAGELASRAALLVDNARLYREAQDATHARDEMLAVVSHDLRSPLHAIVTACEILEAEPTEERRLRTRESIRRAASQMNRLLDDCLDVTRIDEGRLTLQMGRFDLSSLLAEIISLHGPIAENRRIRLARLGTDGAGEIDGDRTRVGQAISNLVDNALKFTPEGGEVRIEAELKGHSICVRVSDSGPGIPEDQLPRLFDRFWRAGNGDRDGVGLGLAIAKGIVEAHRGQIEVESRSGEGTVFSILLPVTRPSDSA